MSNEKVVRNAAGSAVEKIASDTNQGDQEREDQLAAL
jgi:hypothetical protein